MQTSLANELLRPAYLRYVYFPLFPERKPKQFSLCWEYPEAHMDGPVDVVVYPMVDWHVRQQRTQHLIRALAQRGLRCLVVNLNLGREYPRGTRGVKIRRLEERVYELHVRLPREPVYHHRLLTDSEARTLARAIQPHLSSNSVHLFSFPIWLKVVEKLGGKSVYDCHDLLEGFGNIDASIVREEPRCFEHAGLLTFSSHELLRRAGRPEKSRLLQNGVDWRHFQSTDSASPGDAVGYAGALERWFDRDCLKAAAGRLPGTRFVVVGKPESEGLPVLSNIEYAGEADYASLPGWYSRFRVGLIPFSLADLTLAVNPVKLYEYFSLGLPVVSTNLPEVAAFGDLVYIAGSPGEFAARVEEALREDDPERRARRVQAAKEAGWDRRAQSLAESMQKLPAD